LRARRQEPGDKRKKKIEKRGKKEQANRKKRLKL